MGKSIGLGAKQDELKGRLQHYRSLPEYILDGVGALFQRLFNPKAARTRTTFLPPDASQQENEAFPSYWLNGVAIAFFTFLAGWVVAAVTGRVLSVDEVKLMSWAVLTGALALIANKVNIRAFLNTFRDSCADKILRVADIVPFHC